VTRVIHRPANSGAELPPQPSLPSGGWARPLQILFLDSWLPASHEGSGTAVGIRTLAEGLRALGHSVETLRPRQGGGTLLGRARFNLSLPRQLGVEKQPDLVVGFDVDGLFWGNSSRRRSPYVLALKGIAADEARYSQSAGEKLLLSTLARWEKTNAEGAELILVPSFYSAGVAQREYGCPRHRIRVVPEPIDLSLWEPPHAHHPLPDRPTILSVARQYPRKDTATLLQAAERLRRAVPDLHLRIIGGGPELPRLLALSSELGLEDTVTFHGALPEDREVRTAFREAHLFALPSLQEGFGIVFLEAMAAGLPVVAARAGAAPEVISEGETGLLVPPGDPARLAAALLRLLHNPEEGARMGEAGKARVLRYGSEATALAFLAAVAPILKDSIARSLNP